MTHRPLAHCLEQAAHTHAQRLALRGEDQDLSYEQLLTQAHSVAQRLGQLGVAKDDAVMLKSSNHPLDFVGLLGIWLACAVAVPVHRTSPSGVVEAIQAKAQCRFQVDLLAADAASAVLVIDPRATFVEPGDSMDRSLLRGAALVIFTSGSTGLPKGVVLSHEAFAAKLQQNQHLLGLGVNDVTLLVLNNTFSFGIWMALLTLEHGGTVVTRTRFSPQAFLDTLVREGVTRVGIVPTMVRATFSSMLEHELSVAAAQIRTAAHLRDVVIGGEPLGSDLSAKLRAFIAPADLYDIYGLTETSTCDFVLTPQDYPKHPGTIGQVARGVRCRVMNDVGTVCPAGVPGELQLQTPYIMAGYLGDPEMTRAAFAGEWFRTGDLVTQDAEGFVTVVGRLKQLIVRGGNKITPLEIERALCTCSGVAAALVTGLPDPVLGQRIHAVLVAEAGVAIDAAVVRAELMEKLEKYKHPDVCYISTELPTGRTGKIDRSQFQTLLLAGVLAPLASWSHYR